MPSEYTHSHLDIQSSTEAQQGQVKLCSRCHCTVDQGNFVFLPGAEAIVCASCRNHLAVFPSRDVQQLETLISCTHVEAASPLPSPIEASPTRSPEDRSFQADTEMKSSVAAESESDYYYCSSAAVASTCDTKIFPPTSLEDTAPLSSHSSPHAATPAIQSSSYSSSRRRQSAASSPLTDITRLRVRSQGHHCLYPGATFQGTQKSGRNSYDVNVTIVDVDFASSFLCGYLRIRGLTDDWPEITTYFDAEIIGNRYGFLTQNWGATEHEDIVHWSRFPAFRHVKSELKKPLLTIGDRERGAVFMRWKERFLVPDHRVQDISGASFAGFYYVCVDFNPASSKTSALPLTPEHDESDTTPLQLSKSESPRRSRRDSSARRRGRSPSAGPRHSAPVASMSGFYFHQNSEPYQQLSLSHIPERSSSSFEFR